MAARITQQQRIPKQQEKKIRMTNVLEYLENSAERFPDKTAFEDPDRSVTFGELEEKAGRIGTAVAGFTQPRQPVPVFMGKDVRAVEAFFGAVYAGCFYSLIDVKQPKVRLLQILEKLQAAFLISCHDYDEELAALGFSGKVYYLEELEETEKDGGCLALIRAQSLDIDPLYCNFTSGSTGVPKGVLVGHRSVIDFIGNFTKLFGITEKDVIGNQAPFDFDVSVKDIYSGLACGATVEIIPTKYFSIPTQLLDLLCEHHVTVLTWAVSALCIISQLHGFDYRIPSEVKKVLFSGEVMPVRQLNIWQEALPDAEFVNLYGPTEITCNCTYYRIRKRFAPGEVLPCGIPFPNEKVFLLDEENHLVAEKGCQGEICVGGTALALGYYNSPEQTEKAFVRNPLTQAYPETIYRTGDLACYDEDGNLCFLSRSDFQIKHMGHRIELGEIDSAFDKVPEVGRACCIYEKNRIVAFYTGEIERTELAKRLEESLPRFMLPNVYVRKESLPLTKNGKIDRKTLTEEYLKKQDGKNGLS